VHRDVYDTVVAGIVEVAKKLKLGPGLEQATEMGPLVSHEQQQRVLGYIQSGVEEGANVLVGGKKWGSEGYFVEPTVLGNTQPKMKVVREEIFGPVLVANAFDTVDEVVEHANNSPYGLVASVWSSDISTVHRIVPRLKVGTVYVNAANLMDPAVPFGGYKQSGYGREMARMAVEMYLETKSVYIAY
jgi:phenylacetaldehyde dehydrogenase